MCRAAWTCRRSTAPHRRRVRWSCLHQDRSAAAAEAAAQLASRPARVNLMLLPNGTCWRHLRTLRMHLHAPRMHSFDFLPVRTITATGPVRQTPWSDSLRSPTTLPTPVLQAICRRTCSLSTRPPVSSRQRVGRASTRAFREGMGSWGAGEAVGNGGLSRVRLILPLGGSTSIVGGSGQRRRLPNPFG